MKKIKFALLIGVAALFLFCKPVQAAKLEFSPASGSYAVGSTISVDIKVDTEGVETMSTDAVITYDNTLLKLDSVTYGNFYGTVLHSEKTNKVLVSGMVSDATKVVSGTGTLASINFSALTNGVTTLTFDCTAGRTDDTNVAKNDLNASDVVTCSALTQASYTIGDGVAASATPTSAASSSTNEGGGNIGGVTEPTAIPNTGALDLLPLAPKLFTGLLFIAIGLIPLLVI